MTARDVDEPGATRPLYPIDHVLVERAIVLRTSPGTKPRELTIRRSVAFEVDGLDRDEVLSLAHAP
ncbi:hypothetical protein DEU34_3037 [Microbacterium sp. AG1240]|uniref:hypothetical protein n=1 Tax=Microbacterium sp. AG1240 TaxID=2183992 RepID=UPI000EB15AFF|nr:hypothetical protein [Microbacterium sp. AG1240]RKT31101.1 hypothetical protein DEU34_3037 [Microbacterium sp. AG1240]